MTFILLIGYALILPFDLIPLIRNRVRHGTAAFLSLYIPALAIGLLLMMHVKIPSVMQLLGDAVEALGLSYP